MTASSLAEPAAGRRSGTSRRRGLTRVWLAAYGVVIAGFGGWYFTHHLPSDYMMSTRTSGVSQSLAVLDRGGPPLLTSDVPYHKGIAVSHLMPAGFSDDEGIYLYLPLLGRITGEHDPLVLLQWFFGGCFSLLLLLYPLLFYEVFGSVVVAVAAPAILWWRFSWIGTPDLYWITAWAPLIGIPLLLLAHRWWPKHRVRAVGVLIAAALCASFANSIRINSGLPILVGALGVVVFTGVSFRVPRTWRFWRTAGWWFRPAAAASIGIAYLAIATFGFDGVRAYRDHVIHDAHFGAGLPTEHPVWHNAYIGLGYLANKYGIVWMDQNAEDRARRADPGAGYLTASYEHALRHVYVQIVEHDTGFVLRTLWTKLRVMVADTEDRFWLAFVFVPLGLAFGSPRRTARAAGLFGVCALGLGAISPLMTLPQMNYELGWLGAWAALALVSGASLWVGARDAWFERRDGLLSGRRPLVRLGAIAAASVAGTAVLAAVARPAPQVTSTGMYRADQSSLVPRAWYDGARTRVWTFPAALPSGWKNIGAVRLDVDSDASGPALYALSPMKTGRPLFEGPRFTLPEGSYRLTADGALYAGGARFTLERAGGGTVGSAGYWWGQATSPTSLMGFRFTLARPTRLRVLISSWSAVPNASAVVISGLRIGRAP